MPRFHILKQSPVVESFRVANIMADFDLKMEHAKEEFIGEIVLPETWNIGCIVGGSGTGKSTIAREVFAEQYINGFDWTHAAVVDDMPKDISIKDIERMFSTVGFGSVPSWVKPFDVLSNGEKMRVELARAMLEKDFICFDEFTSVVNREVAKTACIAINKAVKRTGKQFVAVSCHDDILEYLQPDWVFDTNRMQMDFRHARDPQKRSTCGVAGMTSGKSFASITI